MNEVFPFVNSIIIQVVVNLGELSIGYLNTLKELEMKKVVATTFSKS
jgi:hypothetical protein